MILLVRHGETEWSRDKKHTGRTDVPLTEDGRERARALRLDRLHFALALTSPLQRARETAALAGVHAQPLADLAEWDYGDYEGRTTAEIRQERPGWEIWRDGCPNGEPLANLGLRADRVIQRVLEADCDTVIVAHGHILRVLGARWLEQPPEFGSRLALDTAARCELGYERERRVLVRWNVT